MLQYFQQFPQLITNSNTVHVSNKKNSLTGKPNIISVWAENSVGLVSQTRTGTVVIDKTPPQAGTVKCPAFIQVIYPPFVPNKQRRQIKMSNSNMMPIGNLQKLEYKLTYSARGKFSFARCDSFYGTCTSYSCVSSSRNGLCGSSTSYCGNSMSCLQGMLGAMIFLTNLK